ncbi:MAG TPA: TIGR03936 family radical SAM-associated protein [Candidatus Limnocylindria bacterium]|jgi:radical SAM-linked protein|nr:TIGR03936 family radical SAM-associated protein [Candidatus Limnocylindria bacterium]
MTGRSTTDGSPRQRWQILFARREPALRLRQAELLAEFERAFREAGLPLSQTNAERPRSRLKFAANLPVGVELRGEVLEVYLDELTPIGKIQAATELLPEGLEIVDAREVWHGFPSAASQLRAAEYEVEVRARGDASLSSDELRGAVVRLLAAEKLPGKRRRGESERRSDSGERDLRPYIEDVEVIEVDESARTAKLRMVLRLDPSGAGRPEDVVAALDLPVAPGPAVRTRLLFVDTPPIAR